MTYKEIAKQDFNLNDLGIRFEELPQDAQTYLSDLIEYFEEFKDEIEELNEGLRMYEAHNC